MNVTKIKEAFTKKRGTMCLYVYIRVYVQLELKLIPKMP